MDLTALLSSLSGLGPWGIAIGIGVMLLVNRLGLKLPSLPSLPKTPEPTPAPTPAPLLPDLLSDRPLLSLLLKLLALKSAGNLQEQDKPLLDLLTREIGELKGVTPVEAKK